MFVLVVLLCPSLAAVPAGLEDLSKENLTAGKQGTLSRVTAVLNTRAGWGEGGQIEKYCGAIIKKPGQCRAF